MNREDIYSVLFEQQKDFEEQKVIVKREQIKEILSKITLEMPIIITGVRRCGKSFLLKLIKDELDLKDKGYLYVNFNDERFNNFLIEDFQKIIDFLHERDYKNKSVFFLDEIQEADGWEKWVDRIKDKYLIFITGSNSKLLSKEISSILTGRSISFDLMPFSFREFLDAMKIEVKNLKLDFKEQAIVRKEFGKYALMGGMPKRVTSKDNIVIKELYENIIYRDIIKRFGKLAKQIKEISLYFLSNPSSLISLRSVSEISGIKNMATIKSILDLFENSFLHFFVNKFNYSVKVQIQNPRKVYCIDNGFLVELGFRMSEDKGKLLENLAAVELKRRGEEIFYFSENQKNNVPPHLKRCGLIGTCFLDARERPHLKRCGFQRSRHKECDFVIRKGNKIIEAIQVCHELNKGNEDREFGGLKEAMNKFKLKEGLILTNGQEDEIISEGKKIIIRPVWKWLLEKKTKNL